MDKYLFTPTGKPIMSETLQLRGTLIGHNGWVTQIATNPKDPDTIISASRGKCFQPEL